MITEDEKEIQNRIDWLKGYISELEQFEAAVLKEKETETHPYKLSKLQVEQREVQRKLDLQRKFKKDWETYYETSWKPDFEKKCKEANENLPSLEEKAKVIIERVKKTKIGSGSSIEYAVNNYANPDNDPSLKNKYYEALKKLVNDYKNYLNK